MMDMDVGARRWLAKTARANHWRVANFYEIDDLIQDGYYVYYYAVRRYSAVRDRPHIMALFKTIFTNHIHDLCKGHRCPKMGVFSDARVPTVELDDVHVAAAGSDPLADVLRVIAEAPPALASLLRTLINNVDLLGGPYERRPDGTRETTNQRLCAALGVDPREFDLHGDLLTYLRGRD